MKGRITRTTSRSRAKGKTDFKRLRRMRDAGIDDSDIPRLDQSFWKTATLTMPEPKDRLTIRVDHDVVEWLNPVLFPDSPECKQRISCCQAT